MPPTEETDDGKPLVEVVDELGLYPLEAFLFVGEGLTFTVQKVHGQIKEDVPLDDPSRHISGQELCEGLREYALVQWGLLARTVLERWNITCTYDFGRIVFALIEAKKMQKTDQDSIEDFRNVYDFKTAFESDYRIEHKS